MDSIPSSLQGGYYRRERSHADRQIPRQSGIRWNLPQRLAGMTQEHSVANFDQAEYELEPAKELCPTADNSAPTASATDTSHAPVAEEAPIATETPDPAVVPIAPAPPPPAEASHRPEKPTRVADAIYEWEILIQAPFAFDFFRMLRSLFWLPAKRPAHVAPDGSVFQPSRRRYFLDVLLFNLGRLTLILGMIPFTMLAFSYIATLPFLGMRMLGVMLGTRAATTLAALGLLLSLMIPLAIVLQWFRPGWLRDSYKKSKVELYNIGMAAGLFLAGGMLETLIASPNLPFSSDFEGPISSTPQWTLFFSDLSMNVLFANLPQKLFKGSISNIVPTTHGGASVSLGLLRLLMIVGFVTLVRLMAIKLCINKNELFYGTEAELRSYLPYCGRAEARVVRRIITLMPEEEIVIRNRFRDEPGADLDLD